MATTVRDLITNAARQAGVIGLVDNLNDNETTQALTELNNLMEFLQLQSYYPQNNVTNQITSVTNSFTMGRVLEKENGYLTDYLTGTITGLRDSITTSANPSTIYFDTPTITTTNGDVYYATTSLNLQNGTVYNTDSTRTESGGTGVSFSGPTIDAGSTVSISASNFTVAGEFYKIGDIYADRPNRIIAVTQQDGIVERPLRFIPEDDFDQAYKVNNSVSHPLYYTVRGTFPFMTIEVYPNSTGGTFNVISEIIQGDFELNDEIELPQGYKPLIQYKLAKILAEDYGYAGKAQQLEKRANEMEGSLKKLNNRGKLMDNSGSPLKGGRYDFYTDTWR